MRRCEHEYVRWFNRRRRRDGPLFRGRFQSRRVANAAYWDTLVHYIDDNPVVAGIVSDATKYPWCSAWHYARARRPGWLSRAEVERAVVASTGAACDHDSYRRFTTARDPDASRWIVERRLASTRTTGLDPLDDLVLAAPRAVLDWMRRKAMLADGSSFGDVAASPRRLEQELDRAAGSMRRSMSDEQLLACRAGLLRDFAGLNLREICSRLDRPMSTVMRRIVDHRRRVAVDDPYGEFAAAVAFHAMR
jgi:hypothetical protein